MKRIASLLLTLLVLLAGFPASADTLRLSPLDITLDQVTVESMDPLDEVRLGDLNRMLGHVGITLRVERDGDTDWTGLWVDVDGTTAGEFWIGEQPEGATLILPGSGMAYRAASAESLGNMFGASVAGVSPLMFPDLYLRDAETVADAVFTEREGIGVTTDKNTIRDTNNVNYGAVVKRMRMIPGSADLLLSVAVEACPDGFLKDYLSGVTISQTEDCYALCKKDGKPAKIVFKGYLSDSRGLETHVEFEWKLRRGEKGKEDRDHLTVKFTGDGGSGSFEFRLTRKSGGLTIFDIYRWEMNGFSLAKGEKDTVRITSAADGSVAGEIRLRTSGRPAGILTLTPALQIAGGSLSGTVTWKLQADQTIGGTLSIQPGTEDLRHPAVGTAEPLPDGEALTALTDRAGEAFGTRLMALLVLMDDQEDNLYLRRGLPDETWEEITTAAQAVVTETEAEAE